MTQTSAKQAFWEGVKDHVPYVIGAIPFGMLAGFLAIKLGFEVWHAMALSIFVFAGASQLIGMELMSVGTTVAIVFISALAVNTRFMMYSASLAPHTKHWSILWKIVNAGVMVDSSYALCLKKFENQCENNRWYMLGANALSWASWLTCTYIGALFGNIIPNELALEFALPLTFITMAAVFMKDKTSIIVALIAGGLSMALKELPYNAGLIIAITSGVLAGYLMSTHTDKKAKGEK